MQTDAQAEPARPEGGADERRLRDPTSFGWVPAGITGLSRLREWDAVTSVTCRAEGDECVFVALTQRWAKLEKGPEAVVDPARRGLRGLVEPPYRAVAVRRDGDVWAVGAVRIEVAKLPADTDGMEMTLVVAEDGSRSLKVDGRPAVIGIDVLERASGARFDAYVLRAARLDGDHWEIQLDPI